MAICLLPGSLQLIMEAEAEAESIKVSPVFLWQRSPPDLISTIPSLPDNHITLTKYYYRQVSYPCTLLLYYELTNIYVCVCVCPYR